MIMADSIIGQRFGMLTVLSEEELGTDTRGHRFRRFRCHCDCGNEKTVNYNNILCGLMRSCGCTRFPKNPPVDLTGQRFHNLTVLSEAEPYYPMKGYRKRRWLCKCDCGAETINSTYAQRKSLWETGCYLPCGTADNNARIHT